MQYIRKGNAQVGSESKYTFLLFISLARSSERRLSHAQERANFSFLDMPA